MFLMKDALFDDLYVWSGVWQATGYNAVIFIAALAVFRPTCMRRPPSTVPHGSSAYHPYQYAGHHADHRHHADHGRGRRHEPFL